MAPDDLDRGTHCTYDPSMATDFIGFRIAAAVPGVTPAASSINTVSEGTLTFTSATTGSPTNSAPASKKAVQAPIAPSNGGQDMFYRASNPRQ